MRLLIGCRRLLVVFPLILIATPGVAQTTLTTRVPPRAMIATAAAMSIEAAERRETAAQAATRTRQDSLWNGTLVGMGLGALVGAFAGNAWLESSASAGFNVPLTFGVAGAGAGAAIGALIDAKRDGKAQAPRRTTRMGLAPAIGNGARGAVGWIRF